MAATTYPLFPFICFLGFTLSLVPLPWHLQAWNSGTVYFMLWASLACLNQFVNSVVWYGTIEDPSPLWCEVSIRIIMGVSVAIPAASLCINRRLYKIATIQAVSTSSSDKKRAIVVDTMICVVLPLTYIALQVVIQGHRYDILEDVGCYPAIYNTIPAFFLGTVWPLAVGLISACYCVATLLHFNRRRIELGSFLHSNQSNLTFSRYFRLMALAMTDITLSTPLAIFLIWNNSVANPVSPWISWEDTHFDYWRVEHYSSDVWRRNNLAEAGIEFSRWMAPVCALIFFSFFGLADEAQRSYKKAWVGVTKHFRTQSSLSSGYPETKEGKASIPRTPPRPTFFSSVSSSLTLPAYDATKGFPTSAGHTKRTDFLAATISHSPIHSPVGLSSASFFSCSDGPSSMSSTLAEHSLPGCERSSGHERYSSSE